MLPFVGFFKAKQKSPSELIRQLKDACQRIDQPSECTSKKAVHESAKVLSQLKNFLLVDSEAGEPNPEQLAVLAQEAFSLGLLQLIIDSLGKFDFESRKDAVFIFNALARLQSGTRTPTVEYISNHTSILVDLVHGYEKQELALNYGMMLRECLRHEHLSRLLLYSPEFYLLFDYVKLPTFDIASDAFATLKDLLTKHSSLFASFFAEKYDEFSEKFNELLQSENYVTRRQSLKVSIDVYS